jgi:signal transduction histidine kinase
MVRGIRRLWPQKVRMRLALIYSLLFLGSGSVLLGASYGLVAANLTASVKQGSRLLLSHDISHAQFARLCKKPTAYPIKVHGKLKLATPRPKAGQPTPVPVNMKVLKMCEEAFLAGRNEALVNERDSALHSLGIDSLIILGLMTIVSGGAGWLISGRVLRPVRMITETARRASEQHLGERIALSGARDELKELADTFDDMLERLDRAFAAQRRFVADASHELRTPLTLMRTAIDVTLAKPGRTAEQLEAMAVRVRASIDRSERTIDALLTLAVSDQGRLTRAEPIDLATAAEDAIDAATAEIDRLGLSLHSELGPAETAGDPHLLERMIGNLVDNAVRHNKPGGTVSVSSGQHDGQVFVQVSNSGPVIPADAVPLLFEPFHRLEGRTGARDGVGLGLAIARSIAAAHMATLHASPRPGGGLDVSVTMPGRRTIASCA